MMNFYAFIHLFDLITQNIRHVRDKYLLVLISRKLNSDLDPGQFYGE